MNEFGDHANVSPIAGIDVIDGKYSTHAAVLTKSDNYNPEVLDPFNNSVYSFDQFSSKYPVIFEYYSDYRVDSDGNLVIKNILKPENKAAQHMVIVELERRAQGGQ